MKTPLQRFWPKTTISDGCWTWNAYRQPNGYGKFALRAWKPGVGGQRFAHRFAYELFIGPIPKGLNVLHHCDNPPCVRPDHLFLGTQSDNMVDMVAKGKGHGAKPGHPHHSKGPTHVKLSREAIEDIRRRYAAGGVFQRELAAEYGVTQVCISACVRRKTWA